jgi:predicted ATPase/DNA-binding SARP family transcriptional activator/DNA-binding CsgD family transcriptional regulator
LEKMPRDRQTPDPRPPKPEIASGRPEAVRVELLGGFRVAVGSRVVTEDAWRLRKAAGLIKLLALAPDHRLHREQAMDLLWPRLGPRAAANNLHRTLYSARQALEPRVPAADSRYLRLRDEQLELCPGGSLWVDAEVFEEAAARARRLHDPAAYRAAVDLYAGELLPADRYEAWAEDRREGLHQRYLSLLLEMAGLHEDDGPAIEALARVVAEQPTHEGAHAGLMRLYARSGRRDEALEQYERLREDLGRGLARGPNAASRRLHEEILAGRYPPVRPSGGRPGRDAGGDRRNNLPIPRTSFVGRERELVGLKRALAMTRLLTLTGAGGCGKTRLALEAAGDLVGAYPDGVWLVELAEFSDPALVPRKVAETLKVREQPGRPLAATLADSLRTRELLLVMDNCEHMIDACAHLADTLLEGCTRLRILATSREALNVAGEVNWGVRPLSIPGPWSSPTVQELSTYESARLFLDRARSRLPDFELTPQNARAVATICRELDGIPLAIELSTARMGVLAVEQVAERLEDSLKLLTGGTRTAEPRQRTLRATLDWSHELLSEPERTLFHRLSVFVGGWTLEAAEAVGTGEGIEGGDVLDLLSRLVDKSLVVAEGSGKKSHATSPRYTMLEPVRRYGEERLAASAEAEAVRRRHASWYFELAKEVEPWLRGARQEVWLERLESEYGNLRVALAWALERGEVDLGLWFGGALGEFWYMGGNLGEGRRWLEAALFDSADAPPTPARTKALLRAGWIAWEQGDYEGSAALSEEGLALARQAGDQAGAVAALSSLGWAALLANDLGKASALAEEALSIGRALGDTGGVARALLVPGLAAVVRGDHERAAALHEESLMLARRVGDSLAMALSLAMGALAALGRDDSRLAEALCEEGLARSPQPRVMNVTAFQLQTSAALACSQGRPARAARLWGAAESLRETIGASHSPVEARAFGSYVDAARAGLDAAAWEEAWAEGKAMMVEEAAEYALAWGERQRRARQRRAPAPKEPSSGRQPDGVLTRREQEVARLVARGLTNRQIAGELTISERTVTTHVDHILRKLGATSRAQVAAQIVKQRLFPQSPN